MDIYISVNDYDNYVNGYNLATSEPQEDEFLFNVEDVTHFTEHYNSYFVQNHSLIFDKLKEMENSLIQQKNVLRARRNEECFPLVNRGFLWYSKLSEQQHAEFNRWYDDWLNVTETLIPPLKPSWLN